MPKLSDYLAMTPEQLAAEGISKEEIEYMQEEHETAKTEVDALNNINKKLSKISRTLSAMFESFDAFLELQSQDIPDMDLIEEKMDELEELQMSGDGSQETQVKIGACVADMITELRRTLGRIDETDNNEQ